MARIFITGSSEGLGSIAAKMLAGQGHDIFLHARNSERAKDALSKVPEAKKVLIADISRIEETRKLAADVNEIGRFQAIIHNAGVYYLNAAFTDDDQQMMFNVNSLAPYILTCLIQKPERLIYLSSGMHMQGDALNLLPQIMGRGGYQTYSDTKLHNVILSMIVSRKWPDVYANAVNPGWAPTRMGGPHAPDSLEESAETQAWLAVSNDSRAKVSGRYFRRKREVQCHAEAVNIKVQEQLLAQYERISGITFPES